MATQELSDKTIIAFFVAPLVPGAFASLYFAVPVAYQALIDPSQDMAAFTFLYAMFQLIRVMVVVTLASSVLSYPAAILFGAPTYLVLRFLKTNSLTAYLCSGSLLGLLYGAFLVPLFSSAKSDQDILGVKGFIIFVSFVSGTIAAGSFWLIARPNQNGFAKKRGT
jgi:hypothetical protein